MSLLEQLNRLAQVYLFDIIDSGDKIKFQRQFRPESSLSIPFGDLATHVPGESKPFRYEETHNNISELPSQYEVKFLDQNNNLLPAIERSPIMRGHNQNVITVDFSGQAS